jgi:protein-disulfide isomerase
VVRRLRRFADRKRDLAGMPKGRYTRAMKTPYARSAFCLTLVLACSAWGFARKDRRKPDATCPLPGAASKTSGEQPIATVDGQPIYKRDFTGSAASQMLQIRQQEYKVESEALDALIRQKVVEIEAKEEGISVEQLYQKEVDSKIPEPSDAEAKGFYFAVKSRTPLPFNAVEPQIKEMIKRDETQEARAKYADSLRAKTNIAVFLQPPTVELGANDPERVEGNPKAPVTIVEFADFQCPFCGRVEPTLADLLRKYNGKVNLAFRDFPLRAIHPFAEGAAEAGRCAEAQRKFWPMHDAMYADQAMLSAEDLTKTAAGLGMDRSSFAACLKSGKYSAAIQQDEAIGSRSGVTGTPAFFINGRFLSGAAPEEQFQQIIDSELAAAGKAHGVLASEQK